MKAVFCKMAAASDADVSQWKRKNPPKLKKENIIRNKKVKGEEHFNHKAKLIAARTIGPDCRRKKVLDELKAAAEDAEALLSCGNSRFERYRFKNGTFGSDTFRNNRFWNDRFGLCYALVHVIELYKQ